MNLSENNRKVGSWGTLPSLQHFGGRGARWSFEMGLGRMTSINYSHKPAQNQTQSGQCIVGALLVLKRTMGKLGFIRLTTAWTWGKPPPSPLIVYFVPLHKTHIQMAFLSRDFQMGIPKFPKVGLPRFWGPITLRANLRSI